MIRLGLCCIFRREPIRFRTVTVRTLAGLSSAARVERVAVLIRHNAASLRAALEHCRDHGIGAFRVNSGILPCRTHPEQGYGVADLPGGANLVAAFEACGRIARRAGIRTSFHPDQFVVLASPRPEVVRSSIAELDAQAEVASWIGADVINVHAGGVYGDRAAALKRLAATVGALPFRVRERLTLENDDRSYAPADLLPFCRREGVPFVYDVHHHRCHPDGASIADTTAAALETWDREPLFHVSSPRDGWGASDPRPHHDFVDPSDFPAEWLDLDLTVDVEAKAKELAVARLRADLEALIRARSPAGSRGRRRAAGRPARRGPGS